MYMESINHTYIYLLSLASLNGLRTDFFVFFVDHFSILREVKSKSYLQVFHNRFSTLDIDIVRGLKVAYISTGIYIT